MTAQQDPHQRDWASAAERLRRAMPGVAVMTEAPLGALSTYRVGGPARILVEVTSRDDLLQLAAARSAEGWEVLVVGLGSNLLVSDAGFDGVALRLGAPFAASSLDGSTVTAGGAVPLPVLARQCAAAGLGGFSWAVGVPGSIGGAVRMNAGGHGSDMRESLRWAALVDLATGAERCVAAEDLELGYRRSALANHHVLVEVQLQLRPSHRLQEEQEIREIVRWRRRNQPGGANTGSVFVNPPGDAAGRLVEAAGCKGLRHGSAVVSVRHANFIVADPGGSAEDVRALMIAVADRVEADSGIKLHPETRLVGFDGPERNSS